jgi:hypothetical protein
MGRLDVQIRHGHDGGGWGAVAALIVFIVLAIGGAAHKQLAEAAHVVATIVEVVAWTLATTVILTVAAGLTWVAVKVRRALRARARRTTATVISVTPDRPGVTVRPVDAAGRPAIDRPRPAGSWPLPGWWVEIRPRVGRDDDTTGGNTR